MGAVCSGYAEAVAATPNRHKEFLKCPGITEQALAIHWILSLELLRKLDEEPNLKRPERVKRHLTRTGDPGSQRQQRAQGESTRASATSQVPYQSLALLGWNSSLASNNEEVKVQGLSHELIDLWRTAFQLPLSTFQGSCRPTRPACPGTADPEVPLATR